MDGELVLEGALDAAQLGSLHDAARGCRISRALRVPVTLRLALAAAGGAAP